ncbi:hypothetical protein D3C84_1260200 [compost metagenome]
MPPSPEALANSLRTAESKVRTLASPTSAPVTGALSSPTEDTTVNDEVVVISLL